MAYNHDHMTDAMKYYMIGSGAVLTVCGIPFSCRRVDYRKSEATRTISFLITLNSGKRVTIHDDLDNCPTDEFKHKLLLLQD